MCVCMTVKNDLGIYLITYIISNLIDMNITINNIHNAHITEKNSLRITENT